MKLDKLLPETMKLNKLLPETQKGLRQFFRDMFGDEETYTYLLPEEWAWMWFVFREADDRREWFPSGKWATIQEIERRLSKEAQSFLKMRKNEMAKI